MLPEASKNILFQITGSIAAFKACAVISQLVQEGHQVQVLLSQGAKQFVGDATFEGLTGRQPVSDIFAPGEMMGHIDWARWADVFVLCPATANTINRLANGLSDDLIGSVFLAQDFTKPYLIFPAMNSSMLRHPATKGSLERLEEWGAQVYPTASGVLACGEIGFGKLLEPETILAEVLDAAQRENLKLPAKRPHLSRRVLVTAGGTREPIDGVRYITNTSTGKTGVYLAEKLAQRGHQVVLLKSTQSPPTSSFAGLTTESFDSFADLQRQMQSLLDGQYFDLIVHAAAVSDFSLDRIDRGNGSETDGLGKIPSGRPLNMTLVPTPKLISFVRQWSSNKGIKVVGFKLTQTGQLDERRKAVERLFSQSQPDFVIANDLSEIGDHQHLFRVYNRTGMVGLGQSKSEMADCLIRIAENGNPQPTPEPLIPGPEVSV
ncbi:MAG: bifunctional phosphopantothenoylcysteine decarboxylase/phosphopantothenate--cysteine ligase CoaBC [Bdellovibrionales bacterium]|nr:bifunctional phosphopantothenoylcysteine decarboxylase/phosphopantothenate--cysteine ligase CoaBC [Bdellovibrionales bacterium]